MMNDTKHGSGTIIIEEDGCTTELKHCILVDLNFHIAVSLVVVVVGGY